MSEYLSYTVLYVDFTICVSVCVSVCLLTFEVPFKLLFAPASQSWRF